MDEKLFKFISGIILIYAITAYYYNTINVTLISFIILALFLGYLLTKTDLPKITDDKWRLFALIGSITTAVSLMINASVFVRNESTTRIQNLITFNKLMMDIVKDIENDFMKYPKELGYLYHDIFGVLGNKSMKNYQVTRDIDMEYKMAMKIFRGFETMFLTGDMLFGVENKDMPEFKGIISTLNTYASSSLMREYWRKVKPMFNDKYARVFIDMFYGGRAGTNQTYVSEIHTDEGKKLYND
jgi:hypothetical protein